MTDAISSTFAASTGAASATSLNNQGTASAAKTTLDKDAFLKLLVAQLKNQDPSSPMDTSQMMAQTTQLSTMEQLTALSNTSRESFALQMRIAASGLVGQQVSAVDADGVTHRGKATGVSFAGEVPMVSVDGITVALDKVSAVGSSASSTPTPAV
jgi:flagellar basal-body rod modification protein FlgD